jgi:hypothetical protein
MKYTFRRFINIIDNSLKQTDLANLYSVPDEGRIATQNQIAIWTNFSLNYLSTVNESFWEKVIEYVVPSDTDTLEMPVFYKTIKSITKNECKYMIGQFGDHRALFYALDDYRIKCANQTSFSAGETIYLEGTFIPEQLKEDCSTDAEREDALNSYIDMPVTYINLLAYSVLLEYAAREKENFPQWFYAKESALKQFRNDSPTINKTGRLSTRIPFGKGRYPYATK